MYAEITAIDERIVAINNSIKSITMGTVTTVNPNPDGSHGVASARYNSTTNKFEFDIPAGANGTPGLTGTTGEQGVQGIQGLKGDTGDIGLTGAQGTTGATGPTGPQGVAGTTGEKGDQGLAGIGIDIQGHDTLSSILAKPSTTIGESWITTTSGVDADGLAVDIDDVIRATGAKWITVGPIEGPAGAQGVQGLQGIQGLQGDVGTQGIQGIQGSTGPKGDTGDTGAQGIQGIQGVDGPQGAAGATGATGTSGESYILRGTDTIANIVAKTRNAGDMWIASDSGTVETVSVIPGDGIYWDGIVDTAVGQIRGPEGIVDFATQGEVDGGTVNDKGVTPVTLANSSLIASKLPLSGGTVTGQIKGITPQAAADLVRMDWVQNAITQGINQVIPIGGIINYFGAFANIPDNYELCNGTNGTPNLVGKFIKGTVTELEVGNTGGTLAATMPSHTHTTPSHEHTMTHNHSAFSTSSNGGHSHSFDRGMYYVSSGGEGQIDSADTNVELSGVFSTSTVASHTHTVDVPSYSGNTGYGGSGVSGSASALGDNQPPYFTLAYIMRVS